MKRADEQTFPEPQITSDEAYGELSAAQEIVSVGARAAAHEVVSVGRGKSFLVELDAAIEGETVALDHIMMARYLSQEALNPHASEDERTAYASRIGDLVSGYFGTRRVIDRHFCTYIPAAIVLHEQSGVTSEGYTWSGPATLDVVYLPEASRTTDPAIEAGLWKARGYYLEASQCRSTPRRDALVRDIFSLIVNLLSLADAEAMEGYDRERTAHALPKVNEELRRVGAAIDRALLIEARQVYLVGMFAGAVALGGGVLLVKILVSKLSQVNIDTLALGVATAGGVGAVLSVMTRLTANNLRVDPGVGRRLVLVAGSFRPLIGGLFAFAVYVFVQGGLLPIEVTVSGVKATYFFLGVAFLAGFSERFAQDAVTRAGSVIADTSPPEQSRNPAEPG